MKICPGKYLSLVIYICWI